MHVLAADMGGTSIKLGIVQDGRLMATAQTRARPASSLKENLSAVHQGWKDLLQDNGLKDGAIEGIGIALPSIVDSEKNSVVSRFVKYADAAVFDFTAWAEANWKVPVLLENDARAALVGEWQYGAGTGCDSLALLTLGTGVGSAVLLNGKLLRGPHFIAGNLWGHMSVQLHGKDCSCGYVGCLETEASAWALEEKWQELAGGNPNVFTGKDISFAAVFEEAARGDPQANKLVDHYIRAWSVCAVNMVHAYDPERILFSGGVMEQSARVLPLVQAAIDTWAWLPPGSVTVAKASQPMYGSLLGLYHLLEQQKKQR